MILSLVNSPLHLLLADDDPDDRFFFEKAIKALPYSTKLSSVDNGEALMNYLKDNSHDLPAILFLDYNMPRKNGAECLAEIKQDKRLNHLPVVICSTFLNEDVADLLYKNGAYYYIRKTDVSELIKVLHRVFILIDEKQFKRPLRKQFILSPPEASI